MKELLIYIIGAVIIIGLTAGFLYGDGVIEIASIIAIAFLVFIILFVVFNEKSSTLEDLIKKYSKIEENSNLSSSIKYFILFLFIAIMHFIIYFLDEQNDGHETKYYFQILISCCIGLIGTFLIYLSNKNINTKYRRTMKNLEPYKDEDFQTPAAKHFSKFERDINKYGYSVARYPIADNLFGRITL